MNKDTLIGIGLGALAVWLVLRRRSVMALAGGPFAGAACCGGCATQQSTRCGVPMSGTGDWSQGNGPAPIRGF